MNILLDTHTVLWCMNQNDEVETLPFLHRDPFDRLLVATAKVDGMTLLTADENIRQYDIASTW